MGQCDFNNIQEALWLKEETSRGVYEPLDENDTMPLNGSFEGKQALVPVDNKEKTLSFDMLPREVPFFAEGEFTIPIYIKPSGALGVVPAGAPVLKGIFGRETIDPGVSVRYDLAEYDSICPLSFTAIHLDGPKVKFITGLSFSQGPFPVKAGNQDDSLFGVIGTGVYIKEVVAGMDYAIAAYDGTSTPVTEIVLETAGAFRLFEVGARIMVGTDDGAGLGLLITAIDEGTNTLTIAVGVTTAQLISAVVKGWHPDWLKAGNLVHGRWGAAQESNDGGSTYATIAKFKESTLTIDNKINIDNETKNNSKYPDSDSSFRGDNGKRDITLDLSKIREKDGVKYGYFARNNTSLAIKIPVGDLAGYRARFEIPDFRANKPDVTGEDQKIQDLSGPCYSTSAGNDAVALIFD